MNKADTILPDSIAIFPHLLAFDLAFKRQLDKVPIENLLVYLIDRVPADSLPLLAKQFDVLGYKGMRLAQTEKDQRNLIKNALKLHRYVGTVWAIEEALKSIGFSDVIITEGVNGHWAKFSVTISNDNVQITAAGYADIIAMINQYKNARSQLDSIRINIIVDDVLTFGDDVADVNDEIGVLDNLYLNATLFYDGTGDYDGTYDHSGDSDVVEIV
jgi:phage tail P2-like protein